MIGKADLQNLIKKIFGLLAGIQILLGIIRLAGNVTETPIALLSVSVAWIAYTYFLRSIMALAEREKVKRIAGFWAAYIVTFPMILHCHMNNFFLSFGTSLLMILLTGLYYLGKKSGEQKLRLPLLLLVGVLALSSIGVGNYVNLRRGGEEYIQGGISSALLSRFAWPYFMHNSYFWEEEVRALFTDDELVQFSTYPESVTYEFGPRLEKAVGKERAREIYRKMAWDSFRIGKTDAIKALGRDLLANAGGPWIVQCQLNGAGVSYTGKNYADMCEIMPGLTRYYVCFSLYSFDFMALFTIVISIMKIVQKKLVLQWRKVVWTLLIAGIIVFRYTMTGNGMQDYLKVQFIFVLWCSLPAWGYGLLSDVNEKNMNCENV